MISLHQPLLTLVNGSTSFMDELNHGLNGAGDFGTSCEGDGHAAMGPVLRKDGASWWMMDGQWWWMMAEYGRLIRIMDHNGS